MVRYKYFYLYDSVEKCEASKKFKIHIEFYEVKERNKYQEKGELEIFIYMFFILILHMTRISKGWEENWGQALPKEDSLEWISPWDLQHLFHVWWTWEAAMGCKAFSGKPVTRRVNGRQRQFMFKVGSSGSPWADWATTEAWKAVEWVLKAPIRWCSNYDSQEE